MTPFPSSLTLLLLSLLAADGVYSLKVPLEARTVTMASKRAFSSRILPRAANTTTSIQSLGNTFYLANLTVGGSEKTVALDTGSSDLWVTGNNINNKNDLGKSTSITYAIGKASGEIFSADVAFAGVTVSNQAFMFVQDGSSAGIDPATSQGLLGLGPSSASNIHNTLNSKSGDSLLDRVFQQDTSTPNFISFILPRLGDPGETAQGAFTIGEVISGHESISNQPKLSVELLPGPLRVDQHWTSQLEGIQGPDGKNISLASSIVPGTKSGELVTVFDSGFTLPQVPHDVSDAIYGRVQGANFDTTNKWWTVPCDQEVNVTFWIAGQPYPVHPLDTVSSDLNQTDSSGKPVCVGMFQPITNALDGSFDVILGMAFLRNTYTLMNYGDFIDGNPQNQGDPFIQLLSITDAKEAHTDFVRVRLNGVDTTGDSSHQLLPSDQEKHSPVSSEDKARSWFFRYWPYVLGGVLILLALAVAGIVYRCCCRRRRVPKARLANAGPYQQVGTPAPQAAFDMHAMGPGPGAPGQYAYADPYHSYGAQR